MCRCWLHENTRGPGPGPCFGHSSTSREDRRVRHGIATLHGRGERHAPSCPLGLHSSPTDDAESLLVLCIMCGVLYLVSFLKALFVVSDASRSRTSASTSA